MVEAFNGGTNASGSHPDAKRYERPLWRWVDDWPQVPGYLHQTLDADLIPKHAVAMLRRALDFGSVVAFVGSGVSMSYGRLGWGELVKWIAESAKRTDTWSVAELSPIDALREPALELPHPHGHRKKREPTPTQRHMRGLLDELRINDPNTRLEIQSGRFPAAFQFLERWSLEMGNSGSKRPETRESRVRRCLRAMLRDDAGQAYLLFERLFSDLESGAATGGPYAGAWLARGQTLVADLAPLNTLWKSVHDDVEKGFDLESDVWRERATADKDGYCEWREAFAISRKELEALIGCFPEHSIARELGRDVCEALFGSDEHASSQNERPRPLAPLHRFVVPALVRIDPWQACRCLWPTTNTRRRIATPRRRAETIAEGRDPLLILLRDFGLTRFVTTNYDLDIERAIVDLGFHHTRAEAHRAFAEAPARQGLSRNALGMTAHASVFRHAQAADLLRLSGSRSTAIQVVHLHGRVFPGEPMVVTEDDYQSMYLRHGDAADAARDAIGLALRSNTVLFVGNGMGEDDILRPMREFVRERRSAADRSAVVLLPADGKRARDVEEVIALYSRYGVMTKHYGLGEHSVAADDKGGVRWLETWLQLCRHLDSTLEGFGKAFDSPRSTAELKRLRTRFAAAESAPNLTQCWLGPVPCSFFPRTINGVPVDALVRSLGLARTFANVAEFALARAVTKATAGLILSFGGVSTAAERPTWLVVLSNVPAAERKSTPTSEASEVDRAGARRLAMALRAMAQGLDGALRSLAILLELASLHRTWLDWKQERTKVPTIRPVGAYRQNVLDEQRKASAEYPRYFFARNRLALRSSGPDVQGRVWPRPVPVTDRFMVGAPSHSFQCFLRALDACASFDGAPVGAGRRRTILILARRGLGKGHFFEMMAENERVAAYLRASWPARDWKGDNEWQKAGSPYAVTCYVNLGVSLEFLSAFDRLSLILVTVADQVFGPGPIVEGIKEASRRLARNRLARLKAVLGLYATHTKDARARLLIAFNGFGQFFDRHGAPKNAQLHRLIEALLGPDSSEVPIDVLMICQDGDLPGRFRSGGLEMPVKFNRDLDQWSRTRVQPLRHLIEEQVDERLRRKLDQTIESLDLAKLDGVKRLLSGGFHILRGARASATVGKYFPEVALAVALGEGVRIESHPADVRTIQDEVIAAFSVVERCFEPGRATKSAPRVSIDALTLSLLGCLVRNADRAQDVEGRRTLRLSELIRVGDDASGPAALGTRVQGVIERLLESLGASNAAAMDDGRSQALERAIDEHFSRLHGASRGNRYLLTITCAAASERGWRLVSEKDPRLSWVFETHDVVQWLDSVRLDAANHLPDDAIDRIIGKVLASHQHAHDQGRMPPAWELEDELRRRDPRDGQPTARGRLLEALRNLRKLMHPRLGDTDDGAPADPARHEQPGERSVSHALCGPLAWRLQQRLLWHMAVMALEVQADVLATTPLVEADCALLVGEMLGVEAGRIRVDDLRRMGICRELVELMMDLLVHRCLAFRMEPVQLGSEEVRPEPHLRLPGGSGMAPVDSGWRFTIHRFLQRTILEQLKAPFVEFPKVDQFGLSMWATQPDELPRPNRSSAHDIAHLVAAWIGFPRSADAMRTTSAYHWFVNEARRAGHEIVDKSDWSNAELWRAATVPARMLRAALGVLRATYSVGVVSRFHDFDDEGAGLSGPEGGYFKQHHQQVRWLLEQAKLLASPDKGLAFLREGVERDAASREVWGPAMEAVAPFYVDELVWLNNECGLFCLVEGRLENAAGMFRQALVIAEEVEGRDLHGALWCRVHLNLAIVDIERGRIREADARLAAIEGVRDENPILRILARGFRALVEHVSGNLRHAEEIYGKVIQDLVLLGQLRSVAIFSRHLAELYRLQGVSAAVKASNAIEQSIAASTKGGHEDIRHLAMLSRVRLAIAGVLPPEVLARARASIQDDLSAAEHYGNVMGMPRLLADVAFARALHLLNLGEMRHAASLASQCLGLCAANGLRLRQMMAMALLGRIYGKRGLPQLAEPLMAQAYAMAVDCHYGNLREASSSLSGTISLEGELN